MFDTSGDIPDLEQMHDTEDRASRVTETHPQGKSRPIERGPSRHKTFSAELVERWIHV